MVTYFLRLFFLAIHVVSKQQLDSYLNCHLLSALNVEVWAKFVNNTLTHNCKTMWVITSDREILPNAYENIKFLALGLTTSMLLSLYVSRLFLFVRIATPSYPVF